MLATNRYLDLIGIQHLACFGFRTSEYNGSRLAGRAPFSRVTTFVADTYSPSTRRVCSMRSSSAILLRDNCMSSANGALGRYERHESAGMTQNKDKHWQH